MSLKWAYGITTVSQRRQKYLPTTLSSLQKAGFDKPVLFVDDCPNTALWRDEFKLEVVPRFPRIRTFGNWTLALLELTIREPYADRYALFQDDLVTYPHLRQYLEAT